MTKHIFQNNSKDQNTRLQIAW